MDTAKSISIVTNQTFLKAYISEYKQFRPDAGRDMDIGNANFGFRLFQINNAVVSNIYST